MKLLLTLASVAALSASGPGAFAQTTEPKPSSTPPAAADPLPPARSEAAPPSERAPVPARWGDAKGWSVEKLLDTDVRTPEGEEVGEIEDVLFDDRGKIAFVVIAAGGFLGIGEKNVAVPLESLELTRDGEGDVRFKMNISKQDLEAAPEYKGLD